MKARKTLAALLFAVVCACAGAFAACAEETYTVTFDVKGHGVAPQSLTEVTAGSKIDKPEDPAEEGYVFNGWFKNDNCTESWDFDTDVVNSDTTLYALWDTQKYTVTFDVKGHGTAPQSLNAEAGKVIDKPEDPVEDGYAFNGWYKDSGLTQVWNFYTDKVNERITLYASWKQVYPVDAETAFNGNVKDVEYFSVAQTGSYLLSVSFDGGKEGDMLDYRLDDETKIAVMSETGTYSQAYYLEKGTHKLAKVLKDYSARVTLQGLDMPLTHAETYMGNTYSFEVASIGVDGNGKKFGVPSVRFGEIAVGVDTANAVSFDGERYTLSARELDNGIYEYYQVKIKLNFYNGKVYSVDVYTKTGDNWNSEPSDVLEPARTAADVAVYMNTNGENSVEVSKTFQYVYFTVNDNKYKWLEFSGFAEGTEFYWVDVNASRTGDISSNKLNIVDGKPIKLVDNDTMNSYLYHIAVKPANGQTSVSFTVKEVAEPAPEPGLTKENPAVLTIDEAYEMECNVDTQCYFTFEIEEAGKYKISAYWDYDGNKIKVTSCILDGVTNPMQFPPTPEQFLAGVEKEYNEAGTHTLVVAANSTSFIVLVEKIPEAADGITPGTYVGSVKSGPFTLEFTFVFDASNNVTITMDRLLGADSQGASTSDATALTDNGGSYSVTLILSGSFKNFTFTPAADGSLNVTGDYTFTATLQQ